MARLGALPLALIAGIAFALLRPTLTDGVYPDGWLGQLQWGAFGAVLWGGGLLAVWQVLSNGLATRRIIGAALIAATVLLVTWRALTAPLEADRLAAMFLTVVVAVSIVGGLWIILNLVVTGAANNWPRFLASSAAILAAVFFAVLRGNLSLTALVAEPDLALFGAGAGWLGRIEWPIFGALIWGGGVLIMALLSNRVLRMGVGVAIGAVTGWFVGTHSLLWQRPALEWPTIIVAVLIGAAIAAFIGYRRRVPIGVAPPPLIERIGAHVLVGAALGWLIATWFLAPFIGTETDTILAAAVPLALLGARLGWTQRPTGVDVASFQHKAQAFLFLGPALLFLTAGLVIPAIRTILLSLLDRNFDRTSFEGNTFDGFTAQGDAYIGLDNYRELWNDVDSFDLSKWQNMFTSQLFWVALALLVTAVVAGLASGTKQNRTPSFVGTGSSYMAAGLGLLLLAFAAFSVLRGTFFNNLWWVVTVTSVSVALGLTIAVLAERAGRLESAVKSVIFMPMAISFVGASIVWRLQYQPRDPTKPQTGVLNALWVQLGRLSHSGLPRIIGLVFLGLILLAIVAVGVRRAMSARTFGVPVGLFIVVGYLFVELVRRSLGGFRFDANGNVLPDTVVFLQEPPFNNVFLMVVLIWIQTGFAMVILSAAIKAVPPELTEAARVDGATESQNFFQVVLPHILPTVGVVTTTLIVLVTKVFDIVKVSTGGNFGTNVLANDMYEVSFSFGNFTLGSAIAVFILISVLPVMFINVRRMQKARMVA